MKRNDELCKAYESCDQGNLTEEQKELFAKLYKEYCGATYEKSQDRHQFYREMISRMVNDFNFEDEELAKFMACEHPTLQQSFMRMVVYFIKEMASKQYYDARNKRSVEMAKLMSAAIENNTYLPMI